MKIHTPLFSLPILGALNANTALAWDSLDWQALVAGQRAGHFAPVRASAALGAPRADARPMPVDARHGMGESD